jgi:hypothetical protein
MGIRLCIIQMPVSVLSIACDQDNFGTGSLTSVCIKVWCVISKADVDSGIFISVLEVACDSLKRSRHTSHTTR